MRTVAALYVDPGGHYPKMVNVDPWDEARDAKKYTGPWPVVAHPPCGPWGAFAHLCRKQDPECVGKAIDSVRKFGGVLEHPRRSRAFAFHGLPLPGDPPDAFGGTTIEVDQLQWGHVAHKWTWLYSVAVPIEILQRPPPFPLRTPTHDLMGGRGRNAKANRGGRIEASQGLRQRTPLSFAEWLVDMARSVEPGK